MVSWIRIVCLRNQASMPKQTAEAGVRKPMEVQPCFQDRCFLDPIPLSFFVRVGNRAQTGWALRDWDDPVKAAWLFSRMDIGTGVEPELRWLLQSQVGQRRPGVGNRDVGGELDAIHFSYGAINGQSRVKAQRNASRIDDQER